MNTGLSIDDDSCFALDYPVGVFEQLALKRALLEEVQRREQELRQEIKALEQQCDI